MIGTVRELGKSKDGLRYAIHIYGRAPDGQIVRERYTRTFTNLKHAKFWADKRVETLIRGEDESGPAAPTLAKLWEDYEEKHVKSARLKPSQQTALRSLWKNHLGPGFGKKRIDAIGFDEVLAFKAARANKAAKTVNNCLIMLKAMLRFAQKQGRLIHLPLVELLKVPKVIPQTYDIATYNKLVAAALELSDRHAAVVLLGGDAGLRAGEMIALDVADLALPMVTLKRNVWRGHEGTLKGNAERMLPLTQRTVDVLARLSEAGAGPVLRTRNGTRLNQTMLLRLLRQAQGKANVPALSLHKLRHTYGTDVTRVLGIRAAQALLGHAQVTTTERYAHVHASAEVAKAIESARLPAKPKREKRVAVHGQRKTG